MSNFRAVATVTATLQRVLQAAIQADVPGATVTTVRPGEGSGSNLPTTGVNLFLYQVASNPHRANDDLPTRRADGATVVRPAAALDVYYLMSFYGDETKLEPQRLLGSATAFLHGQPQLTRAQIQAAVADATKPFLAGSDLADQPDVVRVVPTSLSFDELSRLWSVFLQTHYVLSTTFRASTILLEQQVSTHPSLPAREIRLAAVPLRRPYIQRVGAQAGNGASITPGAAIVVEGSDLSGDAPFVEIDGAQTLVLSADDQLIALALPAGLAAGPHTVLVRSGLKIGNNVDARAAFASNLSAFVLQPVIQKTAGQYNITISQVQGAGASLRSATITIDMAPSIGLGQIATLELLNAQGVAYTFLALPRTAPVTQLSFAAAGVVAGDYFVQVRVDGAASTLDLDINGAPVGPKATIP
jgi:Pvc16 N-terminal domain